MGTALTFGPGKGGPGKTTTTLNLAAAFALEFLREAWNTLLSRELKEIYPDKSRQERMAERILLQLMSQRVQEASMNEEHIITVLSRFKLSEEWVLKMIPLLLEELNIHSVLVCEMDPQQNASKGLGVRLAEGDKSIYDVLLNPTSGIEYAIKRTSFGVDLLPSRGDMSQLELELTGINALRREYRLDDALRQAKNVSMQAIDLYRVIVIDPPPTLGILNLVAINASDKPIAIIDMGAYSVQGLDDFLPRLDLVQQISRRDMSLSGIVCNRYDSRTGFVDQCATAHEDVCNRYPEKVFKAIIPYNPRIFSSPTFGVPVQFNEPRTSTTRVASQSYSALALEIMGRYGL